MRARPIISALILVPLVSVPCLPGVRGFSLTLEGGKASSYLFESALSKDKNAEVERDQWVQAMRSARQALIDADGECDFACCGQPYRHHHTLLGSAKT